MGDPIGAARHVRQTLKPDGSWMIVEPAAADRLEDNLNPVSRMYYAGTTMVCIPTSLDQPVGAALGAQAGFANLSSTITQGGFGKVRKATETPFNMVLEARPNRVPRSRVRSQRGPAKPRGGAKAQPEEASSLRPKRRFGRG